MARRIRTLSGMLAQLRDDRSGNVTMMTMIGFMTLLFALGFAIDFSRAAALQTSLNAIADSAALTAVSPEMISQTDTAAQTAASKAFSAQAAKLANVTNLQTNIQVTATTSSVIGSLRTVTVSYTANSTNLFASILNLQSLAVSGTAVASASQPPSIDFYVALDTSPSMLLPITTSGINALSNVNSGCDFACHARTGSTAVKDSNGYTILIDETFYNNGTTGTTGVYRYNTSNGNVYDANNNLLGKAKSSVADSNNGYTFTYTSNGVDTTVSVFYADTFWLAENYGMAYPSSGISRVTLRTDAMVTAAQGLISTAQTTQTQLQTANPSLAYQLQFFGYNYTAAYPITNALNNANNIGQGDVVPSNGTLEPYMWQNVYLPYQNNPTQKPGYYTDNGDSAPLAMLTDMYQNLPSPGTGGPNAVPQKVLMIVTDGFQDEVINGNLIRSQWNTATLNECNLIKSRGIRIAILYTTYDPASIVAESQYQQYTPKILPALQSCASTASTGGSLVYQVSVNQDITAALTALFQLTVQTARLVQ